jgi:hypothetical protein
LNELTIKINSLRAESNASNNSINGDRIKKLSEEIDDMNQRVKGNEKTF